MEYYNIVVENPGLSVMIHVVCVGVCVWVCPGGRGVSLKFNIFVYVSLRKNICFEKKLGGRGVVL